MRDLRMWLGLAVGYVGSRVVDSGHVAWGIALMVVGMGSLIVWALLDLRRLERRG